MLLLRKKSFLPRCVFVTLVSARLTHSASCWFQQYFELRSRTIQHLRQLPPSQRTAATPDPYPHKFHVSISIPAYIKKYHGLLKEPGDRLEQETVSIAGRIHNNRQAGAKLRFYDVWAEGTRLQVMATAQCVLRSWPVWGKIGLTGTLQGFRGRGVL
jgi:hypothetical protein